MMIYPFNPLKHNKMNVKELRIGNVFINHEADPSKTIYWQVEEICKYSKATALGVKYRNGSSFTTQPTRVVLNEQVLTQLCGFKEYSNAYEEQYFLTLNENDIFYVRPSAIGGWYWGWKDKGHERINNQSYDCEIYTCEAILYLDQLQNLIYRLTNKELIVKIQ